MLGVGEGGGYPHVSRRYIKNGGAVFGTPVRYISSPNIVKISDPGYSKSGHQVMSSDLTSESLNARVSHTE